MSCLLTLTGMSLLLSFLFFFTDQVLSAPLPTPHSFACCLTPYAYNFDHLNVHCCLQLPPAPAACTRRLYPPPARHSAAMPPVYHCCLAGSGIARCVFICPLLRCLLTSPHISHCNSMQHLCALARCTRQVHQGNMWLFLGVRPWSSSRQSSHFRCVVMFLSLLLCH
jgi:hypothetical protein